MAIAVQVTSPTIQVRTAAATTAWSSDQIRALGGMLGRGIVAKSAEYLIVEADRGKTIDCTANTFDVDLPSAATVGGGWMVAVLNSGSGSITIDGDGAETIRTPAGAAGTLVLTQGQSVVLQSDGTNWQTIAASGLSPSPSGTITASAFIGGSFDGTSASGVVTRQAATQDAVRLLGRAGGTSSHAATITPPTLSGSVTITLPGSTATLAGLGLAQTWSAAQDFMTGTAVNSDDAIVAFRVNTANAGVSAGNYSEIQLADVGVVRAYWRNMRDGTGTTIFSFGDNLQVSASGVETARFTASALTLASGKNFAMSGAGTFTSGTGTNTFNGQVTIGSSAPSTVGSAQIVMGGGRIRAEASQQFTRAAGGSGWYAEDSSVADGSRPFAYIRSVSGTASIGTSNRTASTQNTTSSVDAITYNSSAVTLALPTTITGNLTLSSGSNLAMSGAGTLTTGTGLITCNGAIRLNNAAVAATPAATHTITVQDSTGTTYRLLCVV